MAPAPAPRHSTSALQWPADPHSRPCPQREPALPAPRLAASPQNRDNESLPLKTPSCGAVLWPP